MLLGLVSTSQCCLVGLHCDSLGLFLKCLSHLILIYYDVSFGQSSDMVKEEISQITRRAIRSSSLAKCSNNVVEQTDSSSQHPNDASAAF